MQNQHPHKRKLEEETVEVKKQRTEYNYQDIIIEQVAKETKQKYINIKYNRNAYENALLVAEREQDNILASYLKYVVSPTDNKDNDKNQNTNPADNNKTSPLDKNETYEKLLLAAIEIEDAFLLELLEGRVKFNSPQVLSDVVTYGKTSVAKFVFWQPNVNVNQDDGQIPIPLLIDSLGLHSEYLCREKSDQERMLHQLQITQTLLTHPKIDINCTSGELDPEDDSSEDDLPKNTTLIKKEPLNIWLNDATYIPYANTLLTYILAQKSWLANALLENELGYGAEVAKRTDYISLLQTVFNPQPKPLKEDNSFKNICLIALCKMTEIFNDLVRRETILLNTRSYLAGSTALHVAVYSGDHQAVHVLVLAGADITLVDNTPVIIDQKLEIVPSLNHPHFRDFGGRYANDLNTRNNNLVQWTPLQCAIYFRDAWLVHYFLALHSEETLKTLNLNDYIEKHFPNAVKWAMEIRQEALQIAKDLDAPTRVCKSAREGNIPFQATSREIPTEINRYILSFLPSSKIISRDRMFNMLSDVPHMYQQLKIMLQENREIDATIDISGTQTKIDHQKPSIERYFFINFVKEQTDKKIYGEKLEDDYSSAMVLR